MNGVSKQKNKENLYQRIYEIVKKIPYGCVLSYGDVATILGNRGLARTVGYALHALPENTDVPWHRVINSKGKISIRGDDIRAVTQKMLLESEGIVFDKNGKVDMKKYNFLEKSPDNILKFFE